MNVSLKIQLGLNGPQRTLSPIQLDVGSVGAASSWSGSYHVLAMGRHYEEYVITSRLIGLPQIAGLPITHSYASLGHKIRAAGVTGNIGESIAALFARRCQSAGVGDIVHIKPRRQFGRRKSPDYLMNLGHLMPRPFASVLSSVPAPTWPVWWPVESKARSTRAASIAARNDALKQLVAYWTALASSQPTVVGFGEIVTFTYKRPREVRATLLIPKIPNSLSTYLLEHGENVEISTVKTYLYGC